MLLTAGKEIVIPASSSVTREFTFREPGLITQMMWHGTDPDGWSFVLTAGAEAFDGVPFKTAVVGTTFGYRLNFVEPIPVGPGATIKMKLTDTSGSENTVQVYFQGSRG